MITDTPSQSRLTSLWRWWIDALAGLFPEGVRSIVSPRAERAFVAASDIDAPLQLWRGGMWQDGPNLAALSLRKHRGLRRRLQDGRASLVVLTRPGDMVSRQVKLPAGSERDLRAALRFEIERLAPFPAADLLAHAEMAPRKKGEPTVTAQVSFVPKAALADVIAAAEGLGVHAVHAAPDVSTTPLKPLLQPASETRPVSQRLLLVGILLLCLAGTGWVWYHDQTLRRATAEAEAALAEARQRAVSLPDQTGRDLAATSPFARERWEHRQTTPLAAERLRALTEVLPDDTYLTSLILTPERLDVGGSAPEASALIALIEAVPGFGPPQFRAASRRDQDTGRDDFLLTIPLTLDGGANE